MDRRKTSLEKAFELAGSGRCFNLAEIAKTLRAERYDPVYLQGAALKKQLLQLIKSARETAEQGTKHSSRH
jgi:hypothetical protein